MRITKALVIGVLLCGMTQADLAVAATYSWKRAATARDFMLPRVTIIGSSINWGAGEFDAEFQGPAITTYTGAFNLGYAIEQAKQKALDLADACRNPLISQGARTTTGKGGLEEQWLTAQEIFNVVQQQKLLSMYWASYGVTCRRRDR